jgi:hypothetical protein
MENVKELGFYKDKQMLIAARACMPPAAATLTCVPRAQTWSQYKWTDVLLRNWAHDLHIQIVTIYVMPIAGKITPGTLC